MRNLRLVIAYQGTGFAGWQIQPVQPTVQGAIEGCLQQMTGEPCRVRAAGRTDAGVHALGQVASFATSAAIPVRGFLRGLNALLPPEISIRSVDEVSPEFDARRQNKGKRYRYSIWNDRLRVPELEATTCRLHRPLAIGDMAAAARHLVGTHDFAAFRSSGCCSETTVRTIYRCSISVRRPMVQINVEGTAFLRKMIRIVAGTLVEVGQGHRPPESLLVALKSGDRADAGFTAPAHGLCLVRVFQ